MLKSISKNLKKNTVSAVKKNNTVIDFKKNVEFFIIYSFKLSDFEDDETTTVSIKQFIKKKTSEFSLKSNSNYSFSNTLINNAEMIYKFCTCLFKTVSFTRILNNLYNKIINNYCLTDEYDMKKVKAIYIFIQQNLFYM